MKNEWIKTDEKITFTFGGWDGKSYDGETRTQNVYTNPMNPGKKFIKFYSRKFKEYTYHLIDESDLHPITNVPTVMYWGSEVK